MSVRAVAPFEGKGRPLRPYCYECSSKAKTAAAQQKRQERERAAKSVEQRRSLGGVGTLRCPRQNVKKMK